MTTSNPITIHHDWRSQLDLGVELLHESIRERDSSINTIIRTHDTLNEINWAATFNQRAEAHGPVIMNNSQEIMKTLRIRAQTALHHTKTSYQQVRDELETLHKSSKGVDTSCFAEILNDARHELEDKGCEMMYSLGDFGEKNIEQLPEDLRYPAQKVWAACLVHTSYFHIDGLTLLENHLKDIDTLYDSSIGILVLYNCIYDWFRDALSGVQRQFDGIGDPGTRAQHNSPSPEENDEDGLEDLSYAINLEVLAERLEGTGLDNFNLCQRDGRWVVEIPIS